MKGKLIGAAALLALVATVGLALAMWTETLYFNIYVETGSVDLEFDAWCEEEPEAEGKDVASCYAYVTEIVVDDITYPKIVLELSNLYPSYKFHFYVTVTNTGTIPVKIYDFDYWVAEGEDLTPWFDCEHNFTEIQLHPEESVTFYAFCHVLQDVEGFGELPEDAYMHLEGYVVFAQWNEVPD